MFVQSLSLTLLLRLMDTEQRHLVLVAVMDIRVDVDLHIVLDAISGTAAEGTVLVLLPLTLTDHLATLVQNGAGLLLLRLPLLAQGQPGTGGYQHSYYRQGVEDPSLLLLVIHVVWQRR